MIESLMRLLTVDYELLAYLRARCSVVKGGSNPTTMLVASNVYAHIQANYPRGLAEPLSFNSCLLLNAAFLDDGEIRLYHGNELLHAGKYIVP